MKNEKHSSHLTFQTKFNHHLLELFSYNQDMHEFISKWKNKQLILSLKKTLDTEISSHKKESITDLNLSEWKINSFMDINSHKQDLYHKQIHYSFQSNSMYKITHKIYLFLFYFFLSMHSLISKPIIETTPDKVKIHLFFYIFKHVDNPSQFLEINKIKFKWLSIILSRILNKPVELDLVRLHYPYFDSQIFVNLFNVFINHIQLRIIMQTFFKKAMIQNPMKIWNAFFTSSNISGIQFIIGGRLMTQKIVPRQTVKMIRKGSLSRGKWDYLDKARFIHKNRRGAYSLTISIGHSLN